MKVAHMQSHPNVAGVVWDANGYFDENLGIFVPRYIPDPRHADTFTSLAMIAVFNLMNPAIAWAQANWGQTPQDQITNSNKWQAMAKIAGIEF